jgi:hypothetical protein
MAKTVGGLIEDPDSLSYEIALASVSSTKEVVVDTTNYLIKLTRTGNLTSEGVTLQCLYSFLKEKWLNDTNLIFHPFPFSPITNEQYDMLGGWRFDTGINPTTKITVTGCNVTTGFSTVTTSQNYVAANVFLGAFVSGSGIAANIQVVTLTNTSITLSNVAIGTANPTALTFWGATDYTYNLVRTAGWAVKDTISSASKEEWAGIISLGPLGEEGLTYEVGVTANINAGSGTITIADTSTIREGSYVLGPNIPYGTRIDTITSNTQFTVTRTMGNVTVGSLIDIRAYDQPYYQLGANSSAAPTNTVLPGTVNQAVKIYGDSTNGNFDYRRSANILTLYSREQGFTYTASSKDDTGFANITYQAYRFGLTSIADTFIVASDTEISAGNTIPATGSPYNNMRIYWYTTPQVRAINGINYNFSVIIDANITLGSGEYGTASSQEIYEFVQWALRRPETVNINSIVSGVVKNGRTTRALLEYVGSRLTTIYDSSDGGVYIDHFRRQDINDIAFEDNTRNLRQFNYVSFNTITFDDFLRADGEDAQYQVFFNQINQGNVASTGYNINSSLKFGTKDAVLVKSYSTDLSGDGTYEVKGNLLGNVASVAFDFAWDNNLQCRWLSRNTYYAGDEYSRNDGTTTRWYRVKSDIPSGSYTSGLTWSAGLDGIKAEATTLDGPTVVLATVGQTNAEYFTVTGIIERATNNLLASGALEELNYNEYYFTSITGSTLTGAGTGATFNVRARGTNYTVTLSTAGTGYAVNNTIKIAGTLISQSTPDNDIIITVANVGNVTIGNINAITYNSVAWVDSK